MHFHMFKRLMLRLFLKMIVMVLNAKEIIFFLFGYKRYGAVDSFFILSFNLWAQMLNVVTSSIFMVGNYLKQLLINGLISFSIILPSIIIGVSFGEIKLIKSLFSK